MLAECALALSVLSLAVALLNQRAQNRRWDFLNAGSVNVYDVRVKTWRTIRRSEAVKTVWGYQAMVVGFGESDDCKILSRLCAYKGKGTDAQPIQGLNIVVTISELK